MREIKFRAWHEGNKRDTGVFYAGHEPKMLYDGKPGDSLRWLAEGQNISDVMQFTGLLDRHGKEIYEGDVVKGIMKPGGRIWPQSREGLSIQCVSFFGLGGVRLYPQYNQRLEG